MKDMSTSLLDLEKRVASTEAEKELLLNTNAEQVSTGRYQGARNSRMEKGFIETVPPMYVVFAFHVEKSIVPYCSREVSEIVQILSEMKRSWLRHSEKVVELGVPR